MWLVPVAALLAGAVVVAAVPGVGGQLMDRAEYRSTALVLATRVQIGTARLPRLTTAVFEHALVAERAIEDGQLPWSAEELELEHVRLEPLEDNVVILVHGLADDSQLAARTANAVADALVDELNSAGPDVADFTVQTRATPADEPHRPLGIVSAAVVATIAGIAFLLGLVALILAIRRPVSSVQDVVEHTGLPVLATLALPSRRRRAAVDLPGVSALARRLLPDLHGVVAVVAPRGSEASRWQVADVLARRLEQLTTTSFLPLAEDSVASEGVQNIEPHQLPAQPSNVIVIDGPTAATVDAPQLLPHDARAVVVVEEGTPRRWLEPLVRQFLDQELAGVVLVGRGRAGGWRRPRRRTGAYSRQVQTEVGGDSAH